MKRHKVIECGKVDAYGSGRRVNAVTLDIELDTRTENGRPTLSICGEIWNARRTDIIAGGQIREELAKYPVFKAGGKYAKVMDVWKKHHLNDMHAGTERQEDVLDRWYADHKGARRDYDTACRVLKEAGCYDDNGYVYGSKWLYREIPDDVLATVKTWIEEGI